ncbi:uncharacterized protein [Diabrotica undecimpunctata]|uniref:uncharacterized protein isoform X2 n=1 Tax=Diabrotica undecimpunctata TaxID=50387 RepID=UPI003B63C4CD
MAGTGSYTVNRRKDASYKNFICALMAFLAMLILISILLWALRNRGSGSESLISSTAAPTNATGEYLAYQNGPIKDKTSPNVTTTTETVKIDTDTTDANHQESVKTSGSVSEKPTTTTKPVETTEVHPATEAIPVKPTTLPTTTESNPQETDFSGVYTDTTTEEVVTTNKNNLAGSNSQPNTTSSVSSTTVLPAATKNITTLIPTILVATTIKPTTEKPTTTIKPVETTEVHPTSETISVKPTTLPTATESNPQETDFSGGYTDTTTEEVVTTVKKNLAASNSQPNTTGLTTTLIPTKLVSTPVKPTTEKPTTTIKPVETTEVHPTSETISVKPTTLPTATESNSQETDFSGGYTDTTTEEVVTTVKNNLAASNSQPNTTGLTTTLIPTKLVSAPVKPTTAKPTTTTKLAETTEIHPTTKTIPAKPSTLPTTTESSPQETDFSGGYTDTTTEEVVTTTVKKNVAASNSQPKTTLASYAQSTTRSTKPVSSTTVLPTRLFVTPVKPTTGNSAQACQEGVCKRAASVMLAMMNHDDNPNACDDSQNMDYFSVICDNPGESRSSKFFKSSFRNFHKQLNESTEDSVKFFLEFYESCNKFENSVHRLNRTKALSGTGGADVTEAVIKSILAESMPFFDLGLNIVEDKFIFEISLPGVNFLKTKVKGWSVVEQSKDFCIAAEAGTISQDVIDLKERSENINSCIKEITSGYVNEFLIEMQELTSSLSSGKDNLEAIVKSGASSNDLIAILNDIQDSWKAYRSDKDPSLKQKTMTLTELKAKYALGFDWTAVLSKVTTSAITDDTKVYFSEYLDQPFKTLVSKTANLKDMLDLWYSVQMYKNVVMEKQTGNLGHYCIQLTSELIPEVSSHIIHELNNNKEKEELYSLVDTLLDNLKNRFEHSLGEAKFVTDSYRILEDRLNQMQLSKPKPISLKGVSVSQIHGVYQDQLYQLMERYKKEIYSQVDQPVTPEVLLKLFVGAFDTEPKTYPPNREIVFQPGFVSDMNKNIPYYIRVAKHGLLLAEQIAKQFIKNDFTDLASEEATLYEDLFKTLDTKYLLERSTYTVENVKCQIEDESGNNLKYETIVGDNLAFRLATDTFLEDTSKDILPFLTDYSRNKTFLINALQDFCKPNNVADFIGDFYNKETIPAPLRIRNMAKNSKFFADTFNCKDNFERKQFPFLK